MHPAKRRRPLPARRLARRLARHLAPGRPVRLRRPALQGPPALARPAPARPARLRRPALQGRLALARPARARARPAPRARPALARPAPRAPPALAAPVPAPAHLARPAAPVAAPNLLRLKSSRTTSAVTMLSRTAATPPHAMP